MYNVRLTAVRSNSAADRIAQGEEGRISQKVDVEEVERVERSKVVDLTESITLNF